MDVSEIHNGGKKIVLTASAIEMSDFKLNPFIAFTGGFPTKIVPLKLLRKFWYPITPDNPDGSARFAPNGLRKVETLLANEFGEDEVVTCTPDNLSRFVGPNTKAVGVSTMDPLGIGFVSRTYTSLLGFGGEPISAAEFRQLMMNPTLKKYRPKIIVGGSGAWQILKGNVWEEYGIDTIVIGESDVSAVDIFRKAVNGEQLPRVIHSEKPRLEEIPVITKPSLFGTVEVTRGCGKGCQFCSPTMRTRYSFPLEQIRREVEVNVKGGSRMITLQTDDLFLYKCKERFVPNREAIVELVEMVGKTEGVEFIQVVHMALPPAAYDPKLVEEIGPILAEKSRWSCRGRKVACPEVGIETGSVRLIEKYMRGKPLPYTPKEWPDSIVNALGVLNDNDICPLATFLVGLPEETEDDMLATFELFDRLKGAELFYVPLFFTSEEECLLNRTRHADLSQMTDLHWDFFGRCWRRNVEIWAPARDTRFKIFLGSMLLSPYYRLLHGKKMVNPMMILNGVRKPAEKLRAV